MITIFNGRCLSKSNKAWTMSIKFKASILCELWWIYEATRIYCRRTSTRLRHRKWGWPLERTHSFSSKCGVHPSSLQHQSLSVRIRMDVLLWTQNWRVLTCQHFRCRFFSLSSFERFKNSWQTNRRSDYRILLKSFLRRSVRGGIHPGRNAGHAFPWKSLRLNDVKFESSFPLA